MQGGASSPAMRSSKRAKLVRDGMNAMVGVFTARDGAVRFLSALKIYLHQDGLDVLMRKKCR